MVQSPGVNTPQFEWCRTKIGRHPQPVGPVYQPGAVAKAIVLAAVHGRREIYVGWPAALTIVMNKWLPRFFDRYLATHAYKQQFTAQPVPPGRQDNLFQAVPTPYRAHGSFEATAHKTSVQLWLALHRKPLAGVLVLGAVAAFALTQQRKAERAGDMEIRGEAPAARHSVRVR